MTRYVVISFGTLTCNQLKLKIHVSYQCTQCPNVHQFPLPFWAASCKFPKHLKTLFMFAPYSLSLCCELLFLPWHRPIASLAEWGLSELFLAKCGPFVTFDLKFLNLHRNSDQKSGRMPQKGPKGNKSMQQ